MKKIIYGWSIFILMAPFMLLSGCKGGAVPKPQVPVTVVESVKPQVKKPARRAPALSSSVPEKIAVGSQLGGARQGVTLTLKNAVTTFAGRVGIVGSTDGSASRAKFNAPKGIATDGINLYLADLNNHTIRKIEISNGMVTTLAGSAGKKGSDDGKGAAARFNRPYGITVDNGYLYVSDSNNHCIRQIEIESGIVTTIAGGAGKVGYVDGVVKDARFFIPEGITSDGNNLYVSDTHNHSIRKIDLENDIVTTLAGLSGAPGMIDEVGGKARFSYPKGITSDGINLYVIDFGNHRVRKVVIATGNVSTFAGIDAASSEHGTEEHFNYPTGVTSDGRNLYVVDTFNRMIRKVAIGNGAITTVAGKAEIEGFKDAVGSDARFKDPVGITTDGIDLFVTDSGNNTVRKIR